MLSSNVRERHDILITYCVRLLGHNIWHFVSPLRREGQRAIVLGEVLPAGGGVLWDLITTNITVCVSNPCNIILTNRSHTGSTVWWHCTIFARSFFYPKKDHWTLLCALLCPTMYWYWHIHPPYIYKALLTISCTTLQILQAREPAVGGAFNRLTTGWQNTLKIWFCSCIGNRLTQSKAK